MQGNDVSVLYWTVVTSIKVYNYDMRNIMMSTQLKKNLKLNCFILDARMCDTKQLKSISLSKSI